MLAPTPYFADRGCHVRIYEEARSLQALGHQVRIVTYHLGRDMPGIPTLRIPPIPWYGKLTAGPSWHKPYLDLLLLVKALGAVRSFRPDLIHAHLHEGAFIGFFIKKLTGLPLLFDCQGSLTGEMLDHGFMGEGSMLHRFFAFLEERINRFADFIITSSSAGARDLAERWQIPADRRRVLTDGVDTDVFRSYPGEEIRRRLGLATGVPLVVYLGLLNSYQGIDNLLSALVMLKARGSSIRFLLMGFPEEEYIRKARQLGLDDMVRFTGRIDYARAPAYLCAGDLAVSPKLSLTEANGKLYNYMACGVPTVVYDTPVNREILGDVGVYARFGDAADLADQIEALMADGERRAQLARSVRERAVNCHSWWSRGAELAGIYNDMLARGAKGR